MPERRLLFVLAGEPSGDRIGADLVRRLRSKAPVDVIGVGGDELMAEGLDPIYPMSDLSVMGLSDVLKRLPLLLWRVRQTVREILKARPDGVVLIDSQEFAALVAKGLKKAKFDRPVILYVAPSVWARAPERARRIAPLYDEVLSVLPFEPEVMVRLGGPPTFYVGHPAAGEIQKQGADPRCIALLPGSRAGELRRHLPLMRKVVEELAKDGHSAFFLPTLPRLAATLRQELAEWPVSVDVVTDRSERLALYKDTRLAISSAGTATLELALASVPMVITYVMDKVQARHFEKLGRPRVGLPNIVCDADVVPEVLLNGPQAGSVLEAARELLRNPEERGRQQEAFDRLQKLMVAGEPAYPREDPSDRVLAHLKSPTRA